MLRRVICAMVVASVLAEGAALAQSKGSASSRSSTKRIVWTIVGAGAGFGVGVWLGLNKFDDAINSDRKVWASAIVGAAAGGLAGGLLSADRKHESSAIGRRGPSRAFAMQEYPRTLTDVARRHRSWAITLDRGPKER